MRRPTAHCLRPCESGKTLNSNNLALMITDQVAGLEFEPCERRSECCRLRHWTRTNGVGQLPRSPRSLFRIRAISGGYSKTSMADQIIRICSPPLLPRRMHEVWHSAPTVIRVS